MKPKGHIDMVRRIYMVKALPVFALAMLLSCCTSDIEEFDFDTAGSGSPVPVETQLSVTVSENSTLTRVTNSEYASYEYAGTEIGGTNENISSLCVVVMKGTGDEDGVLYCMSLDKGSNADITSYYETIEIDPGTYPVYAFANWETLDNDAINEVIYKIKDNSCSYADLTALNKIVLDDPASLVDVDNEKYIPMTYMGSITVDDDTKMIEVPLTRLVGKVRLTVKRADTDGALSIESLTFSNTADKVSLFADYALTDDGELTESSGVANSIDHIKTYDFTDGESEATIEFYVNETLTRTEGFHVTLVTDEYGGVTYNATSGTTNNLPRNAIYPLTLSLTGNTLEVSVKAAVSPIGSSYVYYDAELNADGNYEMDVLETTSYLELTASLANSTSNEPTYTWLWAAQSGFIGDGYNYTYDSATDSYSYTGATITGNISATTGRQYTISLTAVWESNAATLSREYTIVLNVTDDYSQFTFSNQ